METTVTNAKNIILSADDFGQSAIANKNISELVKLGKIHRVAVLINGFVTGEELDEIWTHQAKVDIHLTLPEGLRKRGGFLRRTAFFLKNHALKKNDMAVIKKNWEGQIEKFTKKTGRVPDGINSHEYIHFYPPYFRLVLDLCDKFGINYVRFGKKGLIGDFNFVFLILRWLHDSNKKTFASTANVSSDYIVSLDWIYPVKFGFADPTSRIFNGVKKIKNFLKNLPGGKTEIICHPERKIEYQIIKNLF